jgi:hypothetical protein
MTWYITIKLFINCYSKLNVFTIYWYIQQNYISVIEVTTFHNLPNLKYMWVTFSMICNVNGYSIIPTCAFKCLRFCNYFIFDKLMHNLCLIWVKIKIGLEGGTLCYLAYDHYLLKCVPSIPDRNPTYMELHRSDDFNFCVLPFSYFLFVLDKME